MKITWLGHACFKVESNGYTIVIDPYEDGSVPGLSPVREEADLVLCTHEHFDHNAADCVTIVNSGAPAVKVTELETWHDDQGGALRGSTKMFVLDDGRERVVHMGDIGGDLTDEQKEFIAEADALMIPVGGFYTIGPKEAAYMTLELGAKYTIPMHYRSKEDGYGLENIGTVYDYAALLKGNVILSVSEIDTDGDYPGSVIILQPQNLAAEA